MRKVVTIIAAVLALAMLTASVAIAGNGRGVEKLDIVQEFDDNGAAATKVVGKAHLIRRANGLKATAQLSGLKEGGVYTFWLVVADPNFVGHPFTTWAALGGSKIVGKNGKATVRIRADVGDPSIEGFFEYLEQPGASGTDPFVPILNSDMVDNRVRIEVAYHGQASEAADAAELALWRTDFWSGQTGVCPVSASPLSGTAQEAAGAQAVHCPVSYAADTGP